MNHNFKIALWTLMLMYGGAVSFDGNGYVHAVNESSNKKDVMKELMEIANNKTDEERLLSALLIGYVDPNALRSIINEQYETLKKVILENEITDITWNIIDVLCDYQNYCSSTNQDKSTIDKLFKDFIENRKDDIRKYIQNNTTCDIYLKRIIGNFFYGYSGVEDIASPWIDGIKDQIKKIDQDKLKKHLNKKPVDDSIQQELEAIKSSQTYKCLKFLLEASSNDPRITKKFNLQEKQALHLESLDKYGIFLASKYLNDKQDIVNLNLSAKGLELNSEKFHYNPISIKPEDLELFPNVETLYLYTDADIEKFLTYNPSAEFINNLPDGNVKNNNGKFSAIEVHAPMSYYDAKKYLARLYTLLRKWNLNGNATDDKKQDLQKELIGHVKFLNVTVDYCEDIGHVDEQTGEFVFNDDVYTGANKDKTYFIKTIDEACFGTMDLVSINIPDSVKSIGDCAFSDCEKLASITIPNSVTSIDNGAFSYCPKLTSITIPNSVTFTPYDAFEGCRGLTSVTLSNNNVRSIDRKMFKDCIRLKSITIPDSIYSVDEMAFANCNSELEFHVPSENMKRYLVDNVGIREDKIIIDVPRSKYAWIWNVAADGILNIPDGITRLSSSMFYKRNDIQSVVIPNSVKYIENGAFEGCTGLTEVRIPNSVQYITERAFKGCTGLISITIPNSVKSIGDMAFEGCTGLTEVRIPNSVQYIKDGAFQGCTKLASVTIPDSVISIEKDAFIGCDNAQFKVPFQGMKNHLHITCGIDENRIIVEKRPSNSENAWRWPENEAVIIPQGVTIIDDYMCKDRTNIKYITIPDSVTYIGRYAFARCKSLESITIPDSIQSIGYWVFDGCKALKNIFVKCSSGKISNKKAAKIKKMIDKAKGNYDKVRFIDANGEEIQPTDE